MKIHNTQHQPMTNLDQAHFWSLLGIWVFSWTHEMVNI